MHICLVVEVPEIKSQLPYLKMVYLNACFRKTDSIEKKQISGVN